MTVSLRIIIGHEPRFYRETLTEALRCLRPELDVVLLDPSDLDQQMEGEGSQLVICSLLSPNIAECALGWVLLYPDGDNRAVISLAGQEREVNGFQIADLLALIDQAIALLQSRAEA